MKKILLLLLIILTSSSLFSYEASCSTEDGKTFNIYVKNGVMTVNGKYTVYYQGKTMLGWYKYVNKGYTYLVGKFEADHFPIKVTNKWGLDTEGTCYFEN